MELQQIISLASLAFTIFVGLIGGFRFIHVQVDTLRREIASSYEKAELLIGKEREANSKARHDLANSIQSAYSTLAVEVKQLQRESVRHDQMKSSEDRMNTQLSKIEAKLDRMSEGLTELAALRMAVTGLVARMDAQQRKHNQGGIREVDG